MEKYPFEAGDKVRFLHNGEIYTFGHVFPDKYGQISSVCFTSDGSNQQRFCAPNLLELVSKREESLEDRLRHFGIGHELGNWYRVTQNDEFSEYYDQEVIDLDDSRNLALLIEKTRDLDVEYACDMIADEEPLTCRKVAEWYLVWAEAEKERLEDAKKARKILERIVENDKLTSSVKVQLHNCELFRKDMLKQLADLGYDENMNWVG